MYTNMGSIKATQTSQSLVFPKERGEQYKVMKPNA